MSRDEYLHLLAEKTELQRMIATTPEDAVIDRASSRRDSRSQFVILDAKGSEITQLCCRTTSQRRYMSQPSTVG
jgi:hypothetical protein